MSELLRVIEEAKQPVGWGYLKKQMPDLDHYWIGIELDQLELDKKIIINKHKIPVSFVAGARLERDVTQVNTNHYWRPKQDTMNCQNCGELTTCRARNQKYCTACSEALGVSNG